MEILGVEGQALISWHRSPPGVALKQHLLSWSGQVQRQGHEHGLQGQWTRLPSPARGLSPPRPCPAAWGLGAHILPCLEPLLRDEEVLPWRKMSEDRNALRAWRYSSLAKTKLVFLYFAEVFLQKTSHKRPIENKCTERWSD